MAHINRRFIDKHWLVYVIRGGFAAVFGAIALFGIMSDMSQIMTIISIFLLFMGIVDSVSALYASTKKHGWFNSVIDATVDVAAAVALLVWGKGDLTLCTVILAVYTVASGLIDIFHGFLSTVDPTDRFIRILAGVIGCVLGMVILNAGNFEISTFVRFFGAYLLAVGITSLIYGVHNRAQNIEDRIARSQARVVKTKKKVVKKIKAGKKK